MMAAAANRLESLAAEWQAVGGDRRDRRQPFARPAHEIEHRLRMIERPQRLVSLHRSAIASAGAIGKNEPADATPNI